MTRSLFDLSLPGCLTSDNQLYFCHRRMTNWLIWKFEIGHCLTTGKDMKNFACSQINKHTQTLFATYLSGIFVQRLPRIAGLLYFLSGEWHRQAWSIPALTVNLRVYLHATLKQEHSQTWTHCQMDLLWNWRRMLRRTCMISLYIVIKLLVSAGRHQNQQEKNYKNAKFQQDISINEKVMKKLVQLKLYPPLPLSSVFAA